MGGTRASSVPSQPLTSQTCSRAAREGLGSNSGSYARLPEETEARSRQPWRSAGSPSPDATLALPGNLKKLKKLIHVVEALQGKTEEAH